jgi:hypothetical protein
MKVKKRRLHADDDSWRKQARPLSQEEKLRAHEESPYTKIECMKIKVNVMHHISIRRCHTGAGLFYVYNIKPYHTHPLFVCKICKLPNTIEKQSLIQLCGL